MTPSNPSAARLASCSVGDKAEAVRVLSEARLSVLEEEERRVHKPLGGRRCNPGFSQSAQRSDVAARGERPASLKHRRGTAEASSSAGRGFRADGELQCLPLESLLPKVGTDASSQLSKKALLGRARGHDTVLPTRER